MSKIIYLMMVIVLIFVKRISVRFYVRSFSYLLRCKGVKIIGTPRFISPWVRFDIFSKISLGDRVVISDNVIFLNHDYSLTVALRASGHPPKTDMAFVEDICVGNNVFIGMNCLILPGTCIGDDVIVGAGSVVKGKIDAGTVVAGNPAKRISSTIELGERWKEEINLRNCIVDVN